MAARMAPQDLKPELYRDLVNIQDSIAQVGMGDVAGDPRWSGSARRMWPSRSFGDYGPACWRRSPRACL